MAQDEVVVELDAEKLLEVLGELCECTGEMCPACRSKLEMWLATNSWKWLRVESRPESPRG